MNNPKAPAGRMSHHPRLYPGLHHQPRDPNTLPPAFTQRPSPPDPNNCAVLVLAYSPASLSMMIPANRWTMVLTPPQKPSKVSGIFEEAFTFLQFVTKAFKQSESRTLGPALRITQEGEGSLALTHQGSLWRRSWAAPWHPATVSGMQPESQPRVSFPNPHPPPLAARSYTYP